MKSLLTLCALLLPTVVLADQGASRPPTGQSSSQTYRVVVIQEPVAFAPTDTDFQADEAKPSSNGQATDVAKTADTQNSNGVETKPAAPPAVVVKNRAIAAQGGDSLNLSYVLPADGNTAYTFFGAGAPTADLRVNLDLHNASLKDAVKQLADQTKQEFVVDADVSNEPRITIVAKHIRLSTALNMLTEAAEVKWGMAIEQKRGTTEKHLTYRIGKKVASTNLRWFDVNGVQGLFGNEPNKWNMEGNNFRLNYQELLDKDGKIKGYRAFPKLDGTLKIDPKSNLYKPLVLPQGNNTLRSYFPADQNTYALGNRLITTNKVSETRATFTCPHCKQQVTVIHQHQTPKCEKCGRTFQDSWDFCPFDGAKRPVTANSDWQFCPLCGKKITEAIKGSAKPDGRSEGKSEPKGNAAVENESKGDANFFTRPGDKTAK